MPKEFCEHLGDYSHNWIRAEAAYNALGKATERLVEEGTSDDLLDLVEVTLKDWQYEVKHLRERFVALVKRGAVTLPEPKEGGAPPDHACCAECGFAVPRLTWPEWENSAAGQPTFRGSELPRSASAPSA